MPFIEKLIITENRSIPIRTVPVGPTPGEPLKVFPIMPPVVIPETRPGKPEEVPQRETEEEGEEEEEAVPEFA